MKVDLRVADIAVLHLASLASDLDRGGWRRWDKEVAPALDLVTGDTAIPFTRNSNGLRLDAPDVDPFPTWAGEVVEREMSLDGLTLAQMVMSNFRYRQAMRAAVEACQDRLAIWRDQADAEEQLRRLPQAAVDAAAKAAGLHMRKGGKA